MIKIVEFINSKNKMCIALVVSIIQLFIYITTKSYLFYLLFGIMFLGIKNIYSIKNGVCKLKEFFNKDSKETSSASKIKFDKNKQIQILKKASDFSLDYTDTIIISTAIGHHASILYSNYNIVLSSCADIFENIYEMILEKSKLLSVKFKVNSTLTLTFILTTLAIVLYGITSLVLFNFLNYFIKICFGHKYIFHNKVVFILMLDFCIAGILLAIIKNKEILRFSHTKNTDPLFILILNISFSIIFSTKFGIIGVVLGSILSKGIINISYEIFESYKNYKGTYYLNPAK
ncbi:MAG: hypothetical protein ACRC6T_17785 [Sarcina sp.]